MTDYLYEYRKALRNGDEEEANKYYKLYRGKPLEAEEDEEQGDKEDYENDLENPSSMTVDQAKEYADKIDDVEGFLEFEREGKNRTTLVSYLEDKA